MTSPLRIKPSTQIQAHTLAQETTSARLAQRPTNSANAPPQKHPNQHRDKPMKRAHGSKHQQRESQPKKTTNQTTADPAKDNHQTSTNYLKPNTEIAIESEARTAAVQITSAAQFSTMIGLKTMYVVCCIMCKVYPVNNTLEKIREVWISNDFLKFKYQISIEFWFKIACCRSFFRLTRYFSINSKYLR